jgi:hypothetical protein
MIRRTAILLAATVFAGMEVLSFPAAADMPMSPVYPTTARPKRSAPAEPPAPAASPVVEKPAPAPGGTKEAAVRPPAKAAAPASAANSEGAGPVFEAAIPPPVAAEPADKAQPPAPAAATPPERQKTATAKPRQRRQPRTAPYAYSHSRYPAAAYTDPQRGWGGGRYGPSPMSDGQ